jgi:polysaccharide export outer membrane protein
MKLSAAFITVSALFLTSCSALPTAGPTKNDVIDQATVDGQARFTIIDIDNDVVRILLSQPTESFHSHFGHYGMPPKRTISVGDTLAVTIWEAGGSALFGQPTLDQTGTGSSTGSRPVTVPDQVVMQDGAISIPFAGRLPVVGRTLFEVQSDIAQRLARKAAEPQVIVTASKSVASTVTVSGEVVTGARVPISPNGDRLLDMIAAAGGARSAVYDTFVRLSRDGVTATIPLDTLTSDPTENIPAWPGDVLTLIKIQQSFDAFGAIGKNAQIPFDAEKITLSQALAKSAGLLDERADPQGVFLLRNEPAALAAALSHAPPPIDQNAYVPVAYHLDMSNAASFFMARQFPVRDKDVVYVANARLDGVQKFFGLIATLTSPIVSGVVVQQAAR